MAAAIRSVDYFYCMVADRPGAAFRLLSQLAAAEVDLLAFSIIPIGPEHAQIVLFPGSVDGLAGLAEKVGLTLTGPQKAIFIQGDDELGALVDIHRQLFEAGVNVYASNGVCDGRGGYGYVLYVRPHDFAAAKRILNL